MTLTKALFRIATWNLQRVGEKGMLKFSDGRPPLTTAMVLNTLERVCLGAGVIQSAGGIFGTQEGWCARADEELLDLIKSTHPYAAFPPVRRGRGIDSVGDAIRKKIHPLSKGLATVIDKYSRGLALFFGDRAAPHIEGLGHGLSTAVAPLSQRTVRFIEDKVPSVVAYLGGTNVGYNPTRVERTLQYIVDEDLLIRAVMAIFEPDLVYGESVSILSPYPIHEPHFTSHPIHWGMELLANKGFLDAEIQIPCTSPEPEAEARSIPVTVFNVHMNDGKTRTAIEVRKKQVIYLAEEAKKLIHAGKRVVIDGDFNIRAEGEDGRPTPEYQWFVSYMNAIGMEEAYQSWWGRNHRERPPYTYDPHIPILPERDKRKPAAPTPEKYPTHGRARYDFIFVGPGLKVKSVRVLHKECLVRNEGMMTYAISDHYPVQAQIEAV